MPKAKILKNATARTARPAVVSGGAKKPSTKRIGQRALHGMAHLNLEASASKRALTVPSFRRILKTYPLELVDWSRVLHMKPPTLTGRLDKGIGFHPLEADRIYFVEQLLVRGNEVFGDEDDFEEWLERPHQVLGNKRPKDLLDSTGGIGMVMMELGRIEHGVF